MLGRDRSRCCLGEVVHDYALRALPAPQLLRWDRHVAVCLHCQSAVAAETRLITALRGGGPRPSSSLQASLVALAASMPPPVPLPTPAQQAPLSAAPLPTIAPTAPALHHSPLRAAAIATMAAGATAAAAWSVGVLGAGAQAGLTSPRQQTRPATTVGFASLGGADVCQASHPVADALSVPISRASRVRAQVVGGMGPAAPGSAQSSP
ncbi:MAG: hypothetical protein LWW86_10255 [Micrococcales bacterium]|nr:hypothetical protein [Micrococcales bacterium]